MIVLPVNTLNFGRNNTGIQNISTSNSIHYKKVLHQDTISFTGVGGNGNLLKMLCIYQIPDMYTGQILLPPKTLENIQRNKIFYKPLKELNEILGKYEDYFCPVEKKIFQTLKKLGKNHPDYTLDWALKSLYKNQQKRLLDIQRPIFEELINIACEMPRKEFGEFMDLIKITNKKLAKDPVITPFSEKEFIYKLRRLALPIKTLNYLRETRDINRIIQAAKSVYYVELSEKSKIFGTGKNKRSKKYKLAYQMQPEIIKKNSEKFKIIRDIFEKTSLKNNKELIKLFNDTSSRIHGFPAIEPFQRKTFIYDLKQITRKLKDRELAHKLINKASLLPTSTNNTSAFIVKYANENCGTIGFQLMKGSLCSVDHLLARNNGGKSKLFNYGLCSAYINAEKTNIFFDQWVRMHPETRENCQKYVDKLIELYNNGIFEKISKSTAKKDSLTVDYIYDFAETIKNISPKENPIILDLSKLKD